MNELILLIHWYVIDIIYQIKVFKWILLTINNKYNNDGDDNKNNNNRNSNNSSFVSDVI